MTTFVLVHGAWHGAWCWNRVRGPLESRGHEVVTPQLPSDVAGAGRPEYLDTLDKALAPHSGVVLVTHSMSGLLAPLLAGHEAVASIVLLAAMVPRPGMAWLDNGPAPYTAAMQERSGRLQFDDLGRSTWAPSDAAALFYSDCSSADAAEAVRQLRPDSSLIYMEKGLDLPGRRVRTTYVSCGQDQVLDSDWNAAAAAELLGAERRDIDTGHSPFWSSPRELAALLTENV
jgi:hypothetical protein